ncbi:Leucine-rich repeat-containing protein 31 [Lemmus lemmus]
MEQKSVMRESDWFLKKQCRSAFNMSQDLNSYGLMVADGKETGVRSATSYSLGVKVNFSSVVVSFPLASLLPVPNLMPGRAGDVLETIPGLEELSLSWNNKVSESPQVLRTFQKESKIRTLELAGYALTSQDAEFVDGVFASLDVLKTLGISCNKELGGGFEDVPAQLALQKDLEVFDLHQCSLTADDVASLTMRTSHLAELQKLDLSYSDSVCDTGWAIFCQNLCFLKQLQN